ncbi:MAG: hypothetical protein LBP75_11335 [Planctomycetota bacterium]|jgi:hypothetical protein|nr:hypothetical protein [Planctomycetota bacterium]
MLYQPRHPGLEVAEQPTAIGRFAAFWRTALAAGGGVCRLTAGLSDGSLRELATQGGGTVERVPYPGLICFALAGRMSEVIKQVK